MLALAFLELVRRQVLRFREGVLCGLVGTSVGLSMLPLHLVSVDKVGIVLQAMFLGLSLVYQLQRKFRLRYVFNPYNLSLVGFCMLMAVYLAFTPSMGYGLNKTIRFAVKCILPVVALSFLLPLSRREKTLFFAAIVIASSLTALSLFSFGDISSRTTIDDSLNPISTARSIGLGAVICGTLVLAKWQSLRAVQTAGLLGLLALLVSAMIATGSRGPLLALSTAVAGSLVLVPTRTSERVAMGTKLLFGAMLVVVAVYSIPSIYQTMSEWGGFNRLTAEPDVAGTKSSTAERMVFFSMAWRGFLDSKGLGLGTGGFLDLYWIAGESRLYPHNLFLEVAVELGIVGFLAVLIIFSGVIRRILATRKQVEHPVFLKLASALWIYSAANAMVSGDIASNYMLWFFGGTVWFMSYSHLTPRQAPRTARSRTLRTTRVRGPSTTS